MKIRYVGPFPEVDLPATGEVVQQNHQIEVDDEIGRALVKQQDWEKVPTPKKET